MTRAEVFRKIDEEYIDQIVEKAERLAESARHVNKTQLRNLLAAAEQTNSTKMLTLFIRYQAARNKWPEDFGDKLTRSIDETVSSILKELGLQEGSESRAARQRITCLLIGCLIRSRVSRENGEERER